MPGYELIGIEEQNEINEVFKNGGVLFRHGFDELRILVEVARVKLFSHPRFLILFYL